MSRKMEFNTLNATTTALLRELSRRIATLINVTAFQLVEGKTLGEAAPILKRLGLSASEIAGVTASTPNAVSVRLAEAKRKMRRRTSRK